MEYLTEYIQSPTEGQLAQAGNMLRDGKLVVFPTETVYGIGASIYNKDAIQDIFIAKGRPTDNPLIVHVPSIEDIIPLTLDFPKSAKLLADAFWPGPLTIILPKSNLVPNLVSAGLDSVALRIPSHPLAKKILQYAGVPIAAPSANRSGRPSPTNAQHVLQDLSGRVHLVINGDVCAVGVESTVVSCVDSKLQLLRPGIISQQDLEAVVGVVELGNGIVKPLQTLETALSPGLKHKHYAPTVPLILVHASTLNFIQYLSLQIKPGTWALAFTEELPYLPVPAISYGSANNPYEQAQKLFSALHEIDKVEATQVYVHAPQTDGTSLAIYNRLLRAAAFQEIILS